MPTQPETVTTLLDPATLGRILSSSLAKEVRVEGTELLSQSEAGVTYRVELLGSAPVVVKLRAEGEETVLDTEAFQLDYLAQKLGFPSPRVLARLPAGVVGPWACLCLSHLPGLSFSQVESGGGRMAGSPLELELAEALGKLHAEGTSLHFQEVGPEPVRVFARWIDLFSHTWTRRFEAVVCSDRLDPATLDAVDWIHKNLAYFLDVQETPRLIHGNLTSTKVISNASEGEWHLSGCLSPRLSFGHHELDLAVLEFSCGVGRAFFDAYRRHLPIQEGYSLRKYVYMLYFIFERILRYGNTHHILSAVDCTREILQRCGC
jgi:fructosamine-3-kinase